MNKIIDTMEWFSPNENSPPFDETILVMLASTRTDDGMRTWRKCTQITTAKVLETSPSDEYEDKTATDEFHSGAQDDFSEFQFDMVDDNGNEMDWLSDSIILWARYPDDLAIAALAAVEVSRNGN